MLRMKHLALPAALVLALAGCGQKAADTTATDTTSDETVATEEAAADVATVDELVVPEDLAETSESIRAFDPADVTDDAPAVDTYDTADDADDLAFDPSDPVEEGTSDQSKAPSGFTSLTDGGMSIVVPANWDIAWEGAGKYSFVSADSQAIGFMTAWKKEAGHSYDVIEMVSYIPQSLQKEGYTGIEVIDCDALYSTNGTLCDAYIYVRASKGGKQYIRYYEFLESRSYVTGLAMAATAEGWSANYDNLKTIANSVTFAPGEGI